VLAVSGYGYQDSRISYSLVGGGTGVIDANDIDWTSTTRLNEKRGVRLSLHNSHATTSQAVAGTPASKNAPVGTAALGCPPSAARQGYKPPVQAGGFCFALAACAPP